ncbi:HDIG domain-containing metalloprotein [Paenibacillus sp. GCM10027626]|uniref:HDIG domain-containing metalloprotein n=1 Tax=Paenibacillus sp. GCM10027626 TaxID=3273411 RepID=UPI003635E1B3
MEKRLLESILLGDEKIGSLEDELLAIVPELIVCKNCEQRMPAHRLPVLSHTYEVVDGVRNDIVLKLAALFHDIGKPYTKVTKHGLDSFKGHEEVSVVLGDLILQRLSFEERVRREVSLLVKYHDYELAPTQDSMNDMIQKIGKNLMLPLLELQLSDLLAHSEQKVNAHLEIRKNTLKFFLRMEGREE